jgi:hypothetical protein
MAFPGDLLLHALADLVAERLAQRLFGDSGCRPGAAPCVAIREEEVFLANTWKRTCLASGETMARELCEEERVLPNGTLVDDYSCPARGPCEGPGIERCKAAYRRGMRGISEAEARNAGFVIPITVPVNGGAGRTVTSSWNASTGYMFPCHDQARAMINQADFELVACGRRLLAAQEGVCTF